MKFIFILLLLLAELSAAAVDTCKGVNLRPQMGPIRNQRDKGWCFANVAADLLGHAYRVQLLETPVSSSFVAINTNAYTYVKNENKPEKIFDDAGLIYSAIRTVQKENYVCPQSIDETLIQQGLNISLAQKLEKYRAMHSFFRQQNQSSEMLNKKEQLIRELKNSKSILSLYPQEKIELALQEPRLDKSVLKLIDLFCEGSKIPIYDHPKFLDYFLAEGKTYDGANKNYQTPQPVDLFQQINLGLDALDPVAISYEVGDITAPGGETGYHASIIVARGRDETGTCKYLIRNSWGEGCEKGAMVNNEYKNVPAYRFPCEAGHIWVDEALIRKSVKGITRKKP